MNGGATSNVERTDGLSAARTLGCILVVLQHCASFYFHSRGATWNFVNAIESLTRVAVPIFFMVTGSLFLVRSDPTRYFFGKRLIRIALPLIFWSVVYMIWGNLNGRAYGNWVAAIFAGPVMYHLWYLYSIIGLSLVTPLISTWFRNAESAERWMVIGAWVALTTILPSMSMLGLSFYGAAFPATGYTILDFSGYMILGATLSSPSGRELLGARTGVAIYLAGCAGTFFLTKAYSRHVGSPSEVFYYYNSAFVILASIGIYAALLRARPSSSYIVRLVSVISASSLGIYTVHPLLMEVATRTSVFSRLNDVPSLSIVVLFAVIFVTSLVIIATLRRMFPRLKAVM